MTPTQWEGLGETIGGCFLLIYALVGFAVLVGLACLVWKAVLA